MEELIRLDTYPIKGLVRRLLQDKTTRKNILFASDSYAAYGAGYSDDSQMTEDVLLGFDSCDIQPRVYKAASEQTERTRKRAEVFTPAWIVNLMNNHCDAEWFGRPDVFNRQSGQTWETILEPIVFPGGKDWKQYVDSRRLEITCGEAPYIVSRYDTATGEIIPIERRIGILDRKMRIVNENAADESEWFKWALRAFQSVYGYEYQGDNLLIARMNLLYTLADYVEARWHRQATQKELEQFLNVICWNFWQMDGLKDTVPLGSPGEIYHQFSLFEEEEPEKLQADDCKIYNWRSQKSLLFRDMKEGMKTMKFDFVIGNPPYQDNTLGDNETYAPPIYHLFLDAACTVSDRVELITPARFLFDAGSTPKAWNQQMLNDPHFKILFYESDTKKVFPNVFITGEIAISYYDEHSEFGAIGVFTPFEHLNSILHKITRSGMFESMEKIVITRTAYRLTDKMHKDHPEAITQLSKGHAYDMSSNIFDCIPQIFFFEQPNDGNKYIRMFGRKNNERTYMYIRREYVKAPANLDAYKIVLAQADGAAGTIGNPIPARVIGMPTVETPQTGTTESFITIGCFSCVEQANAALKYVKTRFVRALVSVLKVTQAIPPGKWKYVPLQNFTSESDIDWSVSIPEIDQQLYAKYGLTQEEIDFIETHVKEME